MLEWFSSPKLTMTKSAENIEKKIEAQKKLKQLKAQKQAIEEKSKAKRAGKQG
jgi:hypothetical protein